MKWRWSFPGKWQLDADRLSLIVAPIIQADDPVQSLEQ
jgi:hypothetical protein